MQTDVNGARYFGNGIWGPTEQDQEWANSLRIEPIPQVKSTSPVSENQPELSPKRTERFAKRFFERYPTFKFLVRIGVPVLALTAIAAACDDKTVWQKAEEEATREALNGEAGISQPEDLVGSAEIDSTYKPFLKYPLPRDSRVKVVQGWIYRDYKDQEPHEAIDYIMGSDLNSADTWRAFPVLAAASGYACQVSFDTHWGENFSVRIKHQNGFETRYLHLNEASLDTRFREFPPCQGDYHNWLFIRQGEKIGNAGDTGTEQGWIHLHFVTINPHGAVTDPYDLYQFREKYPYPDFFLTLGQGRICGPNALFFEEICPRSAQLGYRVTPQPTEVSPPNVEINEQGIINVDYWELALASWEETELRYYNHQRIQADEGWKYIYNKVYVKNTSSQVKSIYDLKNGFIFSLESGSFEYQSHLVSQSQILVPPGFSVPLRFETRVPENRDDFDFVVESPRLNFVEKVDHNEVVTNYDRISNKAEIKDINEAWEIDGYASIRSNGIVIVTAETIANGGFQEQYASFEITNNYGLNIRTSVYTDLELLLLLKDGSIVLGNPYGYSKQIPITNEIAPGQTKTKVINIANNSLVNLGHEGLADTEGAIVVLFYKDFESTDFIGLRWAAWQLP